MKKNNDNGLEITICMGSSCFSRGGNLILQFLHDYLNEQGLSDSIRLKGTLCQNVCQKGPSIKINGTEYNQVDPHVVLDLVKLHLKPAKIVKGG